MTGILLPEPLLPAEVVEDLLPEEFFGGLALSLDCRNFLSSNRSSISTSRLSMTVVQSLLSEGKADRGGLGRRTKVAEPSRFVAWGLEPPHPLLWRGKTPFSLSSDSDLAMALRDGHVLSGETAFGMRLTRWAGDVVAGDDRSSALAAAEPDGAILLLGSGILLGEDIAITVLMGITESPLGT